MSIDTFDHRLASRLNNQDEGSLFNKRRRIQCLFKSGILLEPFNYASYCINEIIMNSPEVCAFLTFVAFEIMAHYSSCKS